MNKKNFQKTGFFILAASILIGTVIFFVKGERSGLNKKPALNVTLSSSAMNGGNDNSLATMYQVINMILKTYLDPDRINAKEMTISALKDLELTIPQLIFKEGDKNIIISIGDKNMQLQLDKLTSPWIMLKWFGDIFKFIQSNVEKDAFDLKDLEYTAINGILKTLDPHTILLTPEFYRSMKDTTSGNFGGLGIVISIRDGNLTVISPITGTPAAKAGLYSGDVILKIDDSSTVNMPINDAVSLMRGVPGTSVTLTVKRDSWDEDKAIKITRAIIKVQSVDSSRTPSGAGYVWIHNFQANTAEDLINSLNEMSKKKPLSGLILDLRSNPGGLLSAAINVSDIFLKKGVIVTTAGQQLSERRVQKATDSGYEPDFPIVILVNSGSASASEIVAGALKGHNRAVVVGERTFGKGSVQVLHELSENTALKITTAQYLTPGDISIQSVGIAPNIETRRVRADKNRIDLKKHQRYREDDLEHHFENSEHTLKGEKPEVTINYLFKPANKDLERESNAAKGKIDKQEIDDSQYNFKFKPDFEITLAEKIIGLLNKSGKISFDKAQLKSLAKDTEKIEDKKLTASFKKIGVDWTFKKVEEPATIESSIDIISAEDDGLKGGSGGSLKITVKNTGTVPVYRLLATTRSDFYLLNEKELAFGHVSPGESVTREFKFKINESADNRTDDVKVSFEDGNSNNFKAVAYRFSINEIPMPSFATDIIFDDIKGGNGDGLPQPGEKITLIAIIKNTGKGDAGKIISALHNNMVKDIFLNVGRDTLPSLKSMETGRVLFNFTIKKGYKDKTLKLKLSVMDRAQQLYYNQNIEYPITAKKSVKAETRTYMVQKDTPLYAYPEDDAPKVYLSTQEGLLSCVRETDKFCLVNSDDKIAGWLKKGSFKTSTDTEPVAGIIPIVNTPPDIILDEADFVTQKSSITITGYAEDENSITDILIYNNEKKIFYSEKQAKKIGFNVKVDLDLGINFITVAAKEENGLQTRKTIAVRRDGKDKIPYITSYSLKGTPESLGVIPENYQSIQPR